MSRNVFAMSDEELLNLDPSTLPLEVELGGDAQDDAATGADTEQTDGAAAASSEAQSGAAQADDAADDAQDAQDASDANEGAAADAADDADAAKDDAADKAEDAAEAKAKPAAEGKDEGQAVDAAAKDGTKPEGKDEGEDKDKDKDKDKAKAAAEALNFESEYKKLLAPFKANGKEMAVQNVDEAIQLMQMGANYNRKMAALKPNLRLLKTLESHGLLDEQKISYLIDLANKDPKAINKLVADSGIDPMDLSAEKASEYRPTNRAVSEKELELDEVLTEIQDTPVFQKTLSVVGKEWDEKSRQVVADAPQLLRVINGHVQSGIYDLIQAEVERERTFGRLNGLSDIEAYRQVGDAIQARGGFDHLASGSAGQDTQGQQTPAPKPVVIAPKPVKADDSKLNEKRRAAAVAKPASPVKSQASGEFNPLSMSDEEFSKMVQSKFL